MDNIASTSEASAALSEQMAASMQPALIEAPEMSSKAVHVETALKRAGISLGSIAFLRLSTTSAMSARTSSSGRGSGQAPVYFMDTPPPWPSAYRVVHSPSL